MMKTFEEYMIDFLKEKKPEKVVEIGPDIQLKLPYTLAPFCKEYLAVSFPDYNWMMRGWHEMHSAMTGIQNVVLVDGDATKLSDTIHKADLIITKNVLIDGNRGQDTKMMMLYWHGELPFTKEESDELTAKFKQAEEQAYREFLKVAKPGHIVRLARKDVEADFDTLARKLGIPKDKIIKEELRYDNEQKETWDAYVIENR